MKVLLLGAGRIARAIVWDLRREPGFELTVADRSPEALAEISRLQPHRVEQADLSDVDNIRRMAVGYDLVVGALPSFLGHAALHAVVGTGTNYVDISFFEEDPFTVHDLAVQSGCTAVVDCGVAPGLSNLMLGRFLHEFERVESFTCYVGGLPADRLPPWEYKAPFAPYDVLAEYTRPARTRAGGQEVVRPALSGLETIEFAEVGELEAFETDGLRSLLQTVEVPTMCEKTARYPGHAAKIAFLRDSGFLNTETLEIGGTEVTPLALTSKLLTEQWHLAPNDDDLTVMRVVVEGESDGRWERHTLDLLDRNDPESGLSSMARTTGFTCTAVARLVAEGLYRRPGVWAPEHLGQVGACYDRAADHLDSLGVRWSHRVEELEPAAS